MCCEGTTGMCSGIFSACGIDLQQKYFKNLILDFHHGMNTDFWFWGLCTVQNPQNQKSVS
jgi:hypothetical protein